jgi:NDP-sugar pyrophosphorylase family protein
MVKAIILCAGNGTRLGSLTKSVPKPMIKINGKPCLQYQIEALKKHGITDIAINTFYLPEQIIDYFEDGSRFGVKIKYSIENELMGTAGALNGFPGFFDETFFVIYGDVIHNTDFSKMLKQHKEKKSFATLAVSKKEDISGGCIVENDRIINFVEKPKEKIPNMMANASIFIAEPEILKYIPQGFSDFGFNVHPKITQNEKVHFFEIEKFTDIGTPDGIKEAEKLFKI